MKIAAPYLKREIYAAHMEALYYCLASSAVLGLSMVYYYDLYARKKDRIVLFTRVAGMLFFFGAYFSLIYATPLNKILWSVLAASLATLLLSWMYSQKLEAAGIKA
ncbi:hypothetical protein D3C71_1868150 [compost metagenome]